MNAFALFLLPIALVSAEARAPACDLRLTIRPHADRVFFGDPLYVEVTILNEGEEPVSKLPPDYDFFTRSWFMISSTDRTGLSYSNQYEYGCPMMGGVKPIFFEPGKPVKFYACVFLPVCQRFDHPFWKRYRRGGHVVVLAVYPFRAGWLLGSCEVTVQARSKHEIARLAYWTQPREDRPEDYRKGPTPADFWFPVYIANRQEMEEFASDTLLEGELGSLVDLSLRFRGLYDSPPDSRQPGNAELIEWLRKQPDVKREVLARKLRGLAGGYNMSSTVKAIEDAFGGKEALGEL
jgi:hypothetical protein